MDAGAKFNRANPAVKRILQECKEIANERSRDFHAEVLEDNIFEWHFAIRGPSETDFEGGIYHGRILLPPEYPFKPPTFSILTPNGRFEINTKICLSISNHHPEHWQPSWSVRTALVALIAFLPTKADGAIGAIEYPPEERRALAKKSRDVTASVSGQSEARAAVTRRVHARMLESESWPADPRPAAAAEAPASADAAAAAASSAPATPAAERAEGSGEQAPAAASASPQQEQAPASPARAPADAAAAAHPSSPASSSAAASTSAAATGSSVPSPAAAAAATPAAVAAPVAAPVFVAEEQLFTDDRSLFLLATFVLGAIMALLVRKVYILGDLP